MGASEPTSGVPLEPIERDTLLRIFFSATERYAGTDALRFKRDGQWRSLAHGEVEARVAWAAAGLKSLGVKAGDRVALLSENRPEWLIADYAILSLGAVTVPIYATLPAQQVSPILADAGVRVAIASTHEQLGKLLQVRGQLPDLEHLVCVEDAPGEDSSIGWSDLLDAGRAADADAVGTLRASVDSVAPDDLATLIYTSGTSGTPKGVMLSHFNLAYMVAATRQHGSLPITAGEVALSLLPLSHVLERAITYVYWDSGATIAYAESIDKAADNMREVRPHFMAGVPRLFDKIYARAKSATGLRGRLVDWAERVGGEVVDAQLAGRTASAAARIQHALADRLVFARLREATGGRLRVFISGGGPLSADVARFFFAARLPVHEGYGLTETSPVLAANRPGDVRLGTVGVPYPGVHVRISGTGEILARSPGLMRGYWNQPDIEPANADGWFATGDIGRLDADGFLWITDRLKDVIITAGGKNIAPQPIEAQVSASPYVAQAVMIGDRRPYPVLLVTPDWVSLNAWTASEGIDLPTAEEVIRHPRVHEMLESDVFGRLQGFAQYERPKKLVVAAEEFTVDSGLLTPTFKVRRRAVEQRYRQRIDETYL